MVDIFAGGFICNSIWKKCDLDSVILCSDMLDTRALCAVIDEPFNFTDLMTRNTSVIRVVEWVHR
jgi:hypothetical protein